MSALGVTMNGCATGRILSDERVADSASSQPMRSVPDDLTVQWLRDRNAACPTCAYNLRGVGHPACPECGTRIVLAIAAAPRALGAWLAGLITLSIVFGFNALMTIAGLPALGRSDVWSGDDSLALSAVAGATVLSGVTLGVIVMRRSRFVARLRIEQWVRTGCTIIWAIAIQACVIGLLLRI